MHRTQQQLTRKCAVCGQIKPLTAFLLQGNSYGNVCADCRAKEAEADERGSTSKGLRIDEKAKNLAELEQKKRLQERKDLRIEELEKREQLADEKKEKKSLTDISEKKHREQYLDIKKALQAPQDKKRAAAKIAAQESDKAEAIEKDTLTHLQNQEAGTQQTVSEKTERVKTGLDFTAPFTGQQIPQAKFHSAEFLKFKQWLGTSAVGMKAFEAPSAQKSDKAEPAKIAAQQTVDNKTSQEKSSTQPAQTSKMTQQINFPPITQSPLAKTAPPEQLAKIPHVDIRSSSLYQPAQKTQATKEPVRTNETLADRMKNTWGSRK